ncbi:glycine zipper 2TM domain-containing protein [Craterilacuibacter sp. RT1T]|uniref:glycine zipper 2TM domain-containing protein n=1 Tax=Craterilacuibacter sp. RT1T TaxID=2942211 RepID=UPI0020C16115|nr:glycine zipper 2TM domain-containing protein [Craterilacuibacter sp. RT1T]MCL6263102.1 glycine zipper 2TM domain-containing protein [Craterilacuibacter sp. RT1T]
MRVPGCGVLALGLVLAMTGCANTGGMGNLGELGNLGALENQGQGGGGYNNPQLRFGRVVSISPVQIPSASHLGIGSVIGAVAGGLLGSQVGGGTGRDVAAVLGALGGGYLGNRLEQNQNAQPQAGQYVVVSLQNGVNVGVTQPASGQLFVGQNVVIEGSGNEARVVPQ